MHSILLHRCAHERVQIHRALLRFRALAARNQLKLADTLTYRANIVAIKQRLRQLRLLVAFWRALAAVSQAGDLLFRDVFEHHVCVSAIRTY